MKLSNIAKLAMISAVVLTLAATTQKAHAVCDTEAGEVINAEVPHTMQVCANIDNVFTADVTDLDFGTVGATHKTAEYGCLVMTAGAAGTLDESNACNVSAAGDRAQLVSDDQAGTAGFIDIAAGNAFNSQEVRMLIQVADEELLCQGASPPLVIGELRSDQTTPAVWEFDDGADVATRNTAADYGVGDTAVDGALEIYIGGELRTDSTAADNLVYESGTCEGSFTVTMFY